MNKHVPYINTQTWGFQTTARQNVKLLDAIEIRQRREEARIELLAWLVVLGMVITVVLVVGWQP